MPLVSAIIPTFRRPALLRAAIQSVLAQTFQDFEIVVVDDNSGDDTEEVVRSFSDPRIRYIGHRTNWRVAAARNTGVLNSVGRYIAFLDDDDEWVPEKLERQLEVFSRCAPVTGVVYGGFTKIDRTSGEVVTTVTPTRWGHILHELCRKNCVGTASTVVIRRDCFDEVGMFDEGINFGEEYDMWIRIAHSFDFAYVADPLVRYSLHGSRLSTSYETMIRGMERLVKKYHDYFSAYADDLSRRYAVLGSLRCLAGQNRAARADLWRAVRIAPFESRNYLFLALLLASPAAFRRLRQPTFRTI